MSQPNQSNRGLDTPKSKDEAVDRGAFDAEAALLALGGKLEWKKEDGKKFERATVAQGSYTVSKQWSWLPAKAPSTSPLVHAVAVVFCVLFETVSQWRHVRRGFFHSHQAVYTPSRGPFDTAFLKSWAAAKAACERHHATGRWGS